MSSSPPESAFGVYIHVPYCARACPYCDFDFRVDRAPDASELLGAYAQELSARVDARVGGSPRTIYVGGGTPSVLTAGGLDDLLAWIGHRWDTSACAEWTVEFNPEHADDERLSVLSSAGVGRVSLGVQSFDAAGLRQLGRAHGPDEAIAAVERARVWGLAVSVDLIVGWPGQTTDGLERELVELLSLGIDHVSVYALTIEAGTPWERLAARGVRRMPRADDGADALVHCERTLQQHGFSHYEIASYARGDARALHNSGYWSGVDYVGIGPSAASACHRGGRVTRRRNAAGAAWWRGDGPSLEVLEPEPAAGEALWLALRMLDGVDLESFLARVDRDRAWVDARTARSRALGNLEIRSGRIRVAPGRWLHHDDIAADVL